MNKKVILLGEIQRSYCCKSHVFLKSASTMYSKNEYNIMIYETLEENCVTITMRSIDIDCNSRKCI